MSLAALPFAAAMLYGLTSLFGPPAIGLKCSRLEGRAQCEVQQSRFLGIAGNTVYVIPESEIGGATTLRAAGGAGRRGGGYTMVLDLRSGAYRRYPVLSGQSFDSVEASTRALNGYLADPGATSLELRESLGSALVMPLIPVVLVGLIAALANLARRRHSTAAEAAPRP
jgi:hypothetical protein